MRANPLERSERYKYRALRKLSTQYEIMFGYGNTNGDRYAYESNNIQFIKIGN